MEFMTYQDYFGLYYKENKGKLDSLDRLVLNNEHQALREDNTDIAEICKPLWHSMAVYTHQLMHAVITSLRVQVSINQWSRFDGERKQYEFNKAWVNLYLFINSKNKLQAKIFAAHREEINALWIKLDMPYYLTDEEHHEYHLWENL